MTLIRSPSERWSQGLIRYRGYHIGDILGKKGLIDTAHLLVWGKWPTTDQRDEL